MVRTHAFAVHASFILKGGGLSHLPQRKARFVQELPDLKTALQLVKLLNVLQRLNQLNNLSAGRSCITVIKGSDLGCQLFEVGCIQQGDRKDEGRVTRY